MFFTSYTTYYAKSLFWTLQDEDIHFLDFDENGRIFLFCIYYSDKKYYNQGDHKQERGYIMQGASILSKLNSAPMYLICGAIVAFVAVVCVIFLIRAYRAGKALGMDTTKMKRVIVSSATFSVLPSVGILLGVIALSGSLGIPWPWLRLSVIGALHYETQVAQAAAEQVGMSKLSASEMTPQSFATIALLMSVCIMWGMVLSIFFNKKYTKKLGSDGGSGKAGFGDKAMTAMFIGLVSAYIGSYIGSFVSNDGLFSFSGDYLPLIVAAASAVVMALFVFLGEKKKLAWVDNFSIAGSMIAGMAVAVLVKAL